MNSSYQLRRFDRVLLIGAGKAVGTMAEEMERMLSHRINEGIIMVPKGSRVKSRLRVTDMVETSHPLPDHRGREGALRIAKLVDEAGRKDLVIFLISGGGSALLPLPSGDVTIEEKAELSESLMKAGASISELNTVRKHLSQLKGGWLARKTYPATLVSLILSDVVGDPLESIASGPTTPDSTTFRDAEKVMKRYSVWKNAPDKVRRRIMAGVRGSIPETPKQGDKSFARVSNNLLGSNRDVCIAAVKELSRAVKVRMLTSFLEGEARFVGSLIGSIAFESSQKLRTGGGEAIVAGGETTVTVVGEGAGGRNTELVLGACPKITELQGVSLASMGTDGVDGFTNAAGAISDGTTLQRGEKKHLDHVDFLSRNDSYSYFKGIEDLIFTGSTGTNLNDVCIAVIN